MGNLLEDDAPAVDSSASSVLRRRDFLAITGAAAIVPLVFPQRANAATILAPVWGIYSIAPTGILTQTDATSFYGTKGLDGIFIREAWNSIESTQGNYDVSNIVSILTQALTYNPSLTFALGIPGGENFPSYLLVPNGVTYQGAAYTIPRASPSIKGTVTTLPLPFDPGYVACYNNMLHAVLKQLNGVTFTNSSGQTASVLTQLRSIKLGLYTGGDSEITIPSWDSTKPGNQSQAAAWLTGFTNPRPLGGGYVASSWYIQVVNTHTNHAKWLVSILGTLSGISNAASITLSMPLFLPDVSFPLIDQSGHIIQPPPTGLPDNTAIVVELVQHCASAVTNPVQAIFTSSSILNPNSKPVPDTLNFNQPQYGAYVNATGALGLPCLAFQTNAWGGQLGESDNATWNTNADPIALSISSTTDCNTFVNLLAFGMMNPQTTDSQGSPPYSVYPYRGYIEVHENDVFKWNNTSSEFGPNKLAQSIFGIVHKTLFGS